MKSFRPSHLITAMLVCSGLTLAACGSTSTPAAQSSSTATSSSSAAASVAPSSAPASAMTSASASAAPSGTAPAVIAPTGLLKDGTLTVCTDPEYPPMEYYKNGTSGDLTGFDSDGATALATLWGLKVSFTITSFDGLMPGLQAKRCDILWSALYLSEKRLQVADGAPFMVTGPGLIVPTGNTDITSSDNLAGKTVAVQGGGVNEQTLKDLSAKFTAAGKGAITIQAYPKTAETVAAVTNGKADALIETDVAVADMVSKSSGKLKEIKGFFPTETKFGVFTAKGSELSKAVAAGLQTLQANGTLGKIAATYKLDPAKISTK